ncbi:hypothetical protein ACFOWM_03160 [Ferruginibacter yonginensis]|uniref:Lipocalin-like domain-containing protein n=1 Tax=Ferruginibacter yonginensis TaxID=1310416 RepID=A0ABV8QQE4_9BACT
MKSIKLLSIVAILIALVSCDAVRQVTNTTGGAVFSLNGKWQLTTNTPENTLVGSIVTVTPFLSEGKLVTLLNNTQCYRVNDVKWKNIKSDKAGGYTIENLLSNCSTSTLNYQAATITVVTNDEIRVVGNNVDGVGNTQTWVRVK